MAIRTRRRARFRRATSGTQNLTTLIYNILKEQQASRKAALLAAFDANMSNANYESTYGGEPVDAGAVEAFYNQMIAAYPEGTTERDRLTAELAEFRVSSANKILSVYGDAYNNGTYAFGEKVDLKSYLAFLRESKAAAPDEATKMKYTSEEFIVNFNDVHDDMKARSASAGSLSTFYRRQLKVAEEMGITKDSKTYRNIQSYLATASKQAAADAKTELRDKANKIILKRAGLMSNALEGAVEAAQREGRITNEEAGRFFNADSLSRVKMFFGFDAIKQRTILDAGNRSGVMLGESALTGSALYDLAYRTKDELRIAVGNPSLSAGDRTFLSDLKTSWDNEIIRPAGLYDDVESAVDSGSDLQNDIFNSFGNPIVNVSGYKAHAQRLSATGAAETAGSAAIKILNGEVPFPDQFGGKTQISELNENEVRRLSELYTGELFLPGSPADAIYQIASEYKDSAAVESGAGFIQVSVDESGTPQTTVVDQPPAGRVPFFYTTKLSDGTTVSSVAMQQKSVVKDTNGTTVGDVVFDIDDGGNVVRNFITTDNYKINLDTMENWFMTNGIEFGVSADGGYLAAVPAGIPTAIFLGSSLSTNPSFAKYVSDKTNVWSGASMGPGGEKSIQDIGSRIASNISLSGSTSDIFSFDSNGLSIRDDLAALQEINMGTAEFNALMQQPIGSAIREAVGTQLFRRAEGAEGRMAMGLAGRGQSSEGIAALRERGAQAAVDYATKRRDAKQEEELSPLKFASSLIPGGPALVQLGQAAYNLINPGEEVLAAKDRLTAARRPGSAVSPVSPMLSGTPASGQDYFFRYSGLSAPQTVSPADSARSSYLGTGIGSAPSFKPTSVSPTFTPQQVQKSINDFRAGERASLNIPISSNTSDPGVR